MEPGKCLFYLDIFKFTVFSSQHLSESHKELKILNKKMQQLVNVITKLSSYTLEDEQSFLKKTFKTAFDLISSSDAGSVYIFDKGKIEFVDTVGHDKELLNNLELDKNDFLHSEKVTKVKNINKNIYKNASQKIKKEYKKAIIPSKETIKFNITSENKTVGGICLDIKK